MADWVLQAKELRSRQRAEARAKYEASVRKYYAEAIQTLTQGKERVCLPVAVHKDVADLLVDDGCELVWIAEQSGNVIYKVDFS